MIGSARGFCLAVLACAVLSACSSHNGASPGQAESYQFSPAPGTGVGQLVVRTAASLVGSPYRYGGRGPDGFDCSGLVHYSYQAAGLDVPRTSAQQFRASTPVGIDEAQPGDLLFFRYGREVSHVGIYLGDQDFVHAPSTGGRVSVTSLRETHYRDRFVRAGRLYVEQ